LFVDPDGWPDGREGNFLPAGVVYGHIGVKARCFNIQAWKCVLGAEATA
jgi:hypothetical protein